MNRILLAAFCFLLSITSKAQINGTDTVCPAYIYTFSATVAGADSFVWSYPTGWFVINGQGNDTVQLYCNQNTGNVCVDGFDAGGNLIAQYCNPVTWGGGGYGWNVAVQPLTPCQCPPSAILIQNNGSGGPCAGCGINGFGSTKTAYAIYDGPWPTGNLMTYAGINSFMGPPTIQTTYYVYYVDTILSQTTPFRITGGLCGGTVNNTFDLFPCYYTVLPLVQSPNPVCVGDIVTIALDPFTVSQLGLSNYNWYSNYGYVSLQGANNLDSVQAIKSSASFNNYNEIEVWAYDMNGCGWTGFAEINVTTCLPDSIFGDSIVCAGYTYNYSATISGAVTYQWTFPLGWYGISGQGTANVSATCNVNDGNVCVEGFDALGNSLGTQCIVTEFGGGGAAGWDVFPTGASGCNGAPFTVTVVPNGTGGGPGCPSGCGNGAVHPNIFYALYSNTWPNGIFLGYVDSTINIGGSVVAKVYRVDVSLGFNPPAAILIEGGCGSGTVNNTFNITAFQPIPASIVQMPASACVGDTITLTETTGIGGVFWGAINNIGLNVLGSVYANPLTAVVISNNSQIDVSGYDANGCLTYGLHDIIYGLCNSGTLTGDSIVCAGYTYNYSATISGAVTYQWTFPSGWYDITGQGTSNVSVTCNVSDGWITATGYDGLGNNVGSVQLETHFSAGSGWDVSPAVAQGCYSDHFSVYVNPNGTGGGPGCPSGCGNGVQHPNIVFGIFSDVWGMPGCQYIGQVNVSQIAFMTGTLYIYQVDISNGIGMGQPILIEGGCGSAVISNEVYVSVIFIAPTFSQSPATACIGDTVTLTCTNGPWSYYQWSAVSNCNVIYQNYDTAIYVVTGLNAKADLQEGCGYGQYNINVSACAIPSVQFASSDTTFCDKQSIDFFDFSTNNPTSWQWTFTGATPNSSTNQNPTGIYYATDGTFDVELIACNANGCDTLLMQNFITEFMAPAIPVITGNSGTMYCSGYSSYQWFLTGSGTVLSTDSFYVPTQQGSYFLIATDTNGCEVASNVFVITDLTGPHALQRGVLTIVPNPNDGNFEVVLSVDQGKGNFELRILNSIGQVVFNSLLLPNQQSGTTRYSPLTTHLESGIYFVELKMDETIWREKVVINK